jgi:hypothetical protein
MDMQYMPRNTYKVIFKGFETHFCTQFQHHLRSQGRTNLWPTLSIFGFLFGPKLLINAKTLMSGYYNKCWNIGPKGLQIGFPNSMVSFFQPWGQYNAIKFSLDS